MSSITKHDAIILEYLLSNVKVSHTSLAEKILTLGYFATKSVRTVRGYVDDVANLYDVKNVPKGTSAIQLIHNKFLSDLTLTPSSTITPVTIDDITSSSPITLVDLPEVSNIVRDLPIVTRALPIREGDVVVPLQYTLDMKDSNEDECACEAIEVVKTSEVSIPKVLLDRLPEGINLRKEDTGEYVYEFESKKTGVFTISVDIIDKIHFDYTSQGNSLTKAQVLVKHGISEEHFKVITEAFDLTKTSSPISTSSPKLLDKEEMEGFMHNQVVEQISDPSIIGEMKRNSAFREYGKQIQIYQDKIGGLTEFIDSLEDRLVKLVIPITEISYNEEDSKIINVVITDIHQGSRIEKDGKEIFNTKILEKQLEIVAKKINSYHSSGVHLSILGDLHESPSGINHKNSWKSMELDAWGANAIIMVVETLAKFCSKIVNLKGINMIGGELVASK